MALPNTLDKVNTWRMRHGAAPTVIDETVAASQNIKRGDVLVKSSGVVSQAIALPGSNNTATASGGNLPIYGIADADITTDGSGVETAGGLTRTTIPVLVFDDNLDLNIRGWNATEGNAQLQDFTKGTAYQFARFRGASADVWYYVLIVTTTNGEMLYVEAPQILTALNTYPNLWVRPIASVRQG